MRKLFALLCAGAGLIALAACAGPLPAKTAGPPAWAQGGVAVVPEPPAAGARGR